MPMFRFLLLLIITLLPHGGIAASRHIKIVAMGDSLLAGYGLESADNFTTQLEQALKLKGHDVEVINAGLSGDTSAGGLSRVEQVIAQKPDVVIFCLGANDALRGLDPKQAEHNLAATLEKLKASGTKILLAGMKAPLNFGLEYSNSFDAIYPPLAQKYASLFYPFLLEGVAMKPELNQRDGLHPNAAGIKVIVTSILPYIEKLL